MADTTQNTELSELEKKLSTESKLATYRKEIAIANQEEAKLQKQILDNLKTEKETLKNDLKAPEIKALEGKITSNGNFIETRILASECLSGNLKKLIDNIFKCDTFKPQNDNTQDNNPQKINFIIYNNSDFAKIELFNSILDYVETLGSFINKTITQVENSLKPDLTDQAGGFEPITFGLATAGILRTAADIFSLFKTNSTLTHLEFAPEEEYIISDFVSYLKKKNPNSDVFYPGIYPVFLIDTFSSESSEFIRAFNNTQNLAIQASQKLKLIENELGLIESEISITPNTLAATNLGDRKIKLKYGFEKLQTSTNSFSQFEMYLLEIDPTTKVSLRSILLNAEKLYKLFKQKNTYIIKLSAKLNGSTKINESLWDWPKAMHSGGAQLNCLIFSVGGSILFSDNLKSYTVYKKSSEIINTK